MSEKVDSYTVSADLDEEQYEVTFWSNGHEVGKIGGITIDEAHDKGVDAVDGVEISEL